MGVYWIIEYRTLNHNSCFDLHWLVMPRDKKELELADPEGKWPNTVLEDQSVKELDGASATELIHMQN
jgi:hypothetical protein